MLSRNIYFQNIRRVLSRKSELKFDHGISRKIIITKTTNLPNLLLGKFSNFIEPLVLSIMRHFIFTSKYL